MKQFFYSIGEKSVDYYSNAGVVNYQLQRHKCTECGSTYTDMIVPPFEYVIEGKRLGDIMDIIPGYYIVSEKVYELFRNSNVSGISFSTDIACVKWTDRKGREISGTVPKFYYMSIEGRCGDVFLSDGRPLQRCPECKYLKLSYPIKTAFNIENWDGSDVFTHCFATGMMCTEKVKDIIEKNNLKNFEIQNCRYTSKK